MSTASLGAYRADLSQLICDSVIVERPKLRVVENHTMLRLDATWIDEILALQAVSADGQTILRDRAYLEAFFARGHDTIFGITDSSGRLVGQATTKMDVALPSILQDHFIEASGAERHAIIGCVTVHPDARGQGLMGKLITLCMDDAKARGMTDVHARVKLGNQASLQNFLKRDFAVAATGPSPEDHTRIVDFLHLKI
jgi:GNAT superfamily N-acetyltransferase